MRSFAIIVLDLGVPAPVVTRYRQVFAAPALLAFDVHAAAICSWSLCIDAGDRAREYNRDGYFAPPGRGPLRESVLCSFVAAVVTMLLTAIALVGDGYLLNSTSDFDARFPVSLVPCLSPRSIPARVGTYIILAGSMQHPTTRRRAVLRGPK